MQTKGKFRLLLLAVGLSVGVQAQETIYVHGRLGCQLFDIRNIKEMRVQRDTLIADFGALCLQVPFDSIAFAETHGVGMRAGWWGDEGDGTAACYYWPDSANVPDVEMTSTDGLCTAAKCFVPHDNGHRKQPRRVGTKWRYTMGTLTRRHRVQLSCFDASSYAPYDMDTTDDQCPYADYDAIDLSHMFRGKERHAAKRTMNYWHRPEAATAMPDSIVFGMFDGVARYEYPLAGDSLHVVVTLERDPSRPDSIFGDTLQLIFADERLARETYAQMDSIDDPWTHVFLSDNIISITERFEASEGEVRQWLVCFDLDLCKPLFLRKDE